MSSRVPCCLTKSTEEKKILNRQTTTPYVFVILDINHRHVITQIKRKTPKNTDEKLINPNKLGF